MLKQLFTWLFLLITLGITWLVSSKAWDNNPICSFRCNHITDWDSFGLFAYSVFAISTLWALYLAAIIYIFLSIIRAVWRKIKKSR